MNANSKAKTYPAAASPAGREPTIPDATLPEFVLGQAHKRGGKRALVEAGTGRELSYEQLAAAVRGTGAWLAAQGVRPGDVLALCAPNSIEFAVTSYAALSAGAILTTVNPIASREEIVDQLRQTGTHWLVTTDGLFAPKLEGAARESGIAETFVISDGAEATPGARRLEVFWPGGEAESPRVDLNPSDVAFLPSSSGTTGLPKSVVLTHRNLVAGVHQTLLGQRVTEDEVVIAATPLFHILGFQAAMNLPLAMGATVVILPRFELGAFLRAIQDYGVTRASVVPPIVLALANSELTGDYDLSSLRVLLSGAAPLSVGVARACAQRVGCRVSQGYGLTELAGATHLAPDDGPDRPDSIGPVVPGVEWRVVDPETQADLGAGEPGELLVRSASAMRGYLNDPEATATTIDADGWVHTGDIVTFDSDGWFRVTDRIKELIKYKGYQVAPAELEEILLTHPAVADAAVVRSPDEAAGEVPKAFIVLKAPAPAAELMAWVAERVAPYKRLRRIEFTSHIPKSPSGKILHRLLADRESAAREADLTGTVVLISGGGRGLGRLLARTLGSAGASVGLLARSGGELAETVAEIELAGGTAAAAIADVTDHTVTAAAVAELRERLGPADVLINNAGVGGPVGPMWDADPAGWWRTFEVNLGGTYTLTRIVLPDMIAAGGGRILNITSNAGVYRWPLMSAYATSKAAVVKLTENLAAETRRHGVSVLSVDPGLLPIGLTEPGLNSAPAPGTPEARLAGWVRDRLASGHGADPGQAAHLILQLAAGRGDRLSGRHLTVADDLDSLVAHIDQIQRDDLRVLRVRTDGRPASQARRPGATTRRSPTPADAHGSAQVVRPQSVPAYYLGRPAHVWMAACRARKSHVAGRLRPEW
jgi:acyl-CoA synthetase (AMP-forming)/AMP-acid ligase II/NAD(P)-dependent dehydrogenase (short-subunit alcohol dehydrogenase family)